ncbi:MAG: helix-turn-helix domain-containing protein [Candidatus Scalindua sp.]|jgi:putative transcriptional regulator|nr:helix-turn-helix domain-containing protein [Candidatus Scalindua sp.]MBT5305344.1 helix-turn-helix domain-containing protein [Candidatus Scalindua sp.]MBT6227922.1 helix-turn-helix domain-containing protein [Candidatus Scalindua sp.]MBT6563494.1 helix-turn-helix domain-containing protein [Candidatus Scalindua sp.]MBT7212188.1 helix-turn-helix domain-containing protein [Candidatus Scalindua sp.]
MRNSMKEAIGSLAQGLLESGLGSPFTEKELNELGVKIPEIKEMSPEKIKRIRRNVNLSQTVFARLLNISVSSIRQWEQGKRHPTGPTKVLLDLLDKEPHALDYRVKRSNDKLAVA